MGLLSRFAIFNRTKPVAAPASRQSPPVQPVSIPTQTPSSPHPGGSSQTTITPKPNNSDKPRWQVLIAGGTEEWFRQTSSGLQAIEPDWTFVHCRDVAEGLERSAQTRFGAVLFGGPDLVSQEGQAELAARSDRCAYSQVCPTGERPENSVWQQPGFSLVAHDVEAETLAHTLKRTAYVRDWMQNRHIKRLLSQIHKLPAIPELYSKVSAELQSPDGSMDTVAHYISQEPVMSAKIFQVVNSAFFGLNEEVTDAAQAALLLGTERIRALILMSGVFSQFGTRDCAGFSPEAVWNHSLKVANYARMIARSETRDAKVIEAAFTAGLLHDVGKLILAGNLPKMYTTVLKTRELRKSQEWRAELEVLGTTHAQLGACLLATWGISLPILEAIAFHHYPAEARTSGFCPLIAVCAGNLFARESLNEDAEAVAIGESLSVVANQDLSKESLQKWRGACKIESGAPATAAA